MLIAGAQEKIKIMAINMYEVLYIQALDNYPYNVEECIEKLQYVLSANQNHVGAHYLLGRIYKEQISDYKKAKYHFEMALYLDHEYTPSYYYYADLLIVLNEWEEASKVIDIGLKIPGNDLASLIFLKGILYEKYEMYKSALSYFKEAKLKGLNTDFDYFIDDQIKRVNNKVIALKKLAKQQKKI